MNYAPGARTWQFARALVDDGHAVCVVAMRIPGAYGEGIDPVDHFERDGVLITTVADTLFREPGVVAGAVDAFQPDVVIGASSTVPALRAVEVAGGRPVWIDLFGDLMAEAQSRLGVHSEEELAPYRDVLLSLLENGDVFSAVSDRQRWAVIGQLGLAGRLNRWTRESRLVHTVPCCVWDPGAEPTCELSPEIAKKLHADDFVLLWSGGFNTWCDVETLIEGVEAAMAADPRIRFVATGGSIRGHDDSTFTRFRERVTSSEHADRFSVLGRIEAEQAAALSGRADAGVVTEKDLVERQLGSSGRVLHWLDDGLPFVCTSLSELGEILAANDLAAVYRAHDPEDLARAILGISSDPAEAEERAARAHRFARDNWSVAASTAPLRSWVETGGAAPDAVEENPLSLVDAIGSARLLSGTRAELEKERSRYHQVRSELGQVHESRMWKVWMFFTGLRDLFRWRRTPPRDADRDEG